MPQDFWDAKDKGGLICISKKDVGGKYAESDHKPIFASGSFAVELTPKKTPILQSGTAQLVRYVNLALPEYGKVCGVRCPMENLLPQCFYNADVAFLIAAWLYSSVVSYDVFPCGLRQWPPPVGSDATSPSALALVAIAPSPVSTSTSSTDPSGSSSKKAAIASPP